jgi:hypothetical protein
VADRFVEWFRGAVERHALGWYDPAHEHRRNRRTEAIRQRAIAERINVERVLAEDYRDGDRALGKRDAD